MRRLLSLAALLLGLAVPGALHAHGGGTPRLTNAPAGPYRVYAWTEPEPVRTGEVHISIAVTRPADAAANAAANAAADAAADAETDGAQVETPVTDAELVVRFAPVDASQPEIRVQASRQTVLNDYYYEVETELPSDGHWGVTVDVAGPAGSGSTGFELEVLPARTLNWTLIAAGVAVLIGLVILMGFWMRTQQSPDAQRSGRAPDGRPGRPETARRMPPRARKPVTKLADGEGRKE